MRTTAIILILLLALTAAATAEESDQVFFNRKAEGWFWYQSMLQEEEPPIPDPLPPPSPPFAPKQAEEEREKEPEKPPVFSVEWLRDNLPKLLDIAIDNPTDENVAAYMYAQRVMMDKSSNFASQVQHVVLSDPMLDENNRFPFATAMRSNVLKMQNEAQKEALKYLATIGGVWFFFDSKCQYCIMQQATIKHLVDDYGFIVKNISLDGAGLPGMTDFVIDSGQARTLSLQLTPAIVLAVPPDHLFILSQGLLSFEGIDSRILLAAEKEDLLSEELKRRINPSERGVLSTEDLKDAPKGDNPAELVNYLKEHLKAKYW